MEAPNEYFGENWNVFLDSFGYLDWIKKPDVFIVHQDLPRLSQTELEIYLDILRVAVARLANEDTEEFHLLYPQLLPRRLTVYFPKAVENTVLPLIGKVSPHPSSSRGI